MSVLYNDLAPVYEAMYNSFIDYDEEYQYYSRILYKYNCKSLVEIGCGTGNLAKLFLENKFQYQGLDLSSDMLAIARQKNIVGNFMQADMRLFKLDAKAESAIMVGRTISYLITNTDVINSFKSVKANITDNGIFVFDCIDANKFIPIIQSGYDITHKASFEGKEYSRLSRWKVNFMQSWTFDWLSTYFENRDGEEINIGTDTSTIRTFTKDEIELFLKICGFEILDVEDRASYAFDTFVVTSKSIV